MNLSALQPFAESVADLQRRQLLPTTLSSAELRQLEGALRRQALFSAQTVLTDYLQEIQDSVTSIVNPISIQRPDRVTPENPAGNVTVGLDPATARLQLKQKLAELGYTPAAGAAGSITDLSSDRRIDLVVKTNTELAQGAGRFIQSNAPGALNAFPAQELVRFDQKEKPRDWPQRWRIAAQVAGDVDAARILDSTGRMVALLSSDIWQELGDGAGGYDDTLGNPYPPFAFNSGMWVEAVSREEAVALGLMQEADVAEPAALDLSSIFSTAA